VKINPQLFLRTPEGPSEARAAGVNKKVVDALTRFTLN
jgi:hypothetical protein